MATKKTKRAKKATKKRTLRTKKSIRGTAKRAATHGSGNGPHGKK